MGSDIDFHRCEKTDYPACAAIGEAAFASDAHALARRIEGIQLHRIYTTRIEVYGACSTYRELAIVDGEVAGFIFGYIGHHFTLNDRCRLVKKFVVLLGLFLLGRFGRQWELAKLLKPLWRELLEFALKIPSSSGEVMHLAVSPGYQGRGIGRKLMDRFVQYARRSGVQVLFVFADESVSFWFYERYGFRRWTEYDSPLSSYLHGKPIKGFSYRLLLHEG